MGGNYPGIPPCFPLAEKVSPCTVAPDQWGNASVGGFYRVELGEGGDFGGTGVWDTSYPSWGIPEMLPKAYWQGDVL